MKNEDSRFFDILKTMEGYIKAGELTVVLGRPGSGCSILLKTIAGNTYGFKFNKDSEMTYDAIKQDEIQSRFRGNVIYCVESDKHFPKLTAGDTIYFVSELKTSQNRGDV